MKASALLGVGLLLLAAFSSVQAADKVIDTLRKEGYTAFAELVEAAGVKAFPANASGTLFVPTNAAVSRFLMQMGLTKAELHKSPELCDAIVSYHFMPGFPITGMADIKANNTAGMSGDPSGYGYTFSTNEAGAYVVDTQGGKANFVAKPTMVGKLSIVPIDSVLKSGNYFTSVDDAMRHYPQLTKSHMFAHGASNPMILDSTNNVTFFIPVNSAWDKPEIKEAVAKLTPADREKVLLHFMVRPAMQIPGAMPAKKYETELKGHSIEIKKGQMMMTNPMSGKSEMMPMVTVMTEKGKAANVTLFNIWVGRSILNGIDRVLLPDVVTGKTAAPAAAAKAADKPAPMPAAHMADDKKAGGRRLLAFAARHLLQRDRTSSFSNTQEYASTVTTGNTEAAIAAAVAGRVPARLAARYGSIQASYDGCFNCASWGYGV